MSDSSVPVQVSAFNHPDQLPSAVQTFMESAERRNIGFGVHWYRNLVSTVYPGDSGVRFYVLCQGAKVVAVLPLRAARARGSWTLESLSNFYTTLYEPLISPGTAAADLTPMLTAMARDFPRFTSLTLAPMDPASVPYQTMLGALRLQGWMAYEFLAFGNWFEPVTSSWKDYLAARHGQLRSTIKRMGKKFSGAGGRLEIITEAIDMEAAIAAYNRVYGASWKRPEPFPEFMPGFIRSCAARGFLRLGLAWVNERPVAAQMWIVSHGRAEIYKLAYDEEFKGYAPGTLLTALLMEHVFDVDKVSEVDYLVGDDPYKQAWMSHRRERFGIVAYNPRSAHGLAGIAYESLAGVVRRARRSWRGRFPQHDVKAA